jgi:hypothetical protein
MTKRGNYVSSGNGRSLLSSEVKSKREQKEEISSAPFTNYLPRPVSKTEDATFTLLHYIVLLNDFLLVHFAKAFRSAQ